MNRVTLSRTVLPLVALTLGAGQLSAQSHHHDAAGPASYASTPVIAPSAEAKQAFAIVKSFDGKWQGEVAVPGDTVLGQMEVAFHVMSRGNAVMHEMKSVGASGDPTKFDHPLSMFYLDGGNMMLTHYCDAGNRPRFTAHVSADGKQVDFEFLDLTGPTTYGHMQHVRFTVIDSTHHLEDWSYLTPSGKTFTGHFELHRVANVAAANAN